MYGKILVPLDGSPFGEYSLPQAMSLARRLPAHLELVTVASPAPPVPGGGSAAAAEEGRERGMAHAAEYLGEVERRVREAGFQGELSTTTLTPGNVAVALVRHCSESGTDLIVMTTHGRGAVRRAWLGSIADGFIRRSHEPVLLIRPPDGAEESPDPELERLPPLPRKVLLPLDGSSASEALLGIAPPLAAEDAAFRLLRVIPPYQPGGSPYLPHVVRENEEQDRIRRGAESYLKEKARILGEGAEISVHISAQPAQTILRDAEEWEADLIAMSTAGRGGAARLLLGSVADKVIRSAPCPVLLHREQSGG